jgi:acyl-coenzyme A synthetase/AMP-(fatty) acid ligase
MMNFATLFTTVTETPATQEHFITDGKLTCQYAEVPHFLEKIDAFLSAHEVYPQHCIAVECNNSVPSALLLIYLLSKRIGFMLLPPTDNSDKGASLKPIPQFCHIRLKVATPPLTPGALPTLDLLESFYHVEARDTPTRANQIATEGLLFTRTSGSMGEAKIVVQKQEKVLSSAFNCIKKYNFTAEDRMTIPVPIFHMYGFGAEFLPALILGCCIDLQENSNLLKYLDRERRFSPTVAFITPNLCEMLLRGWKTPKPYKVIVTSGQRIREDLFAALDALCGNHLVNQYGSTEMGPISACAPNDDFAKRISTIGSPMADVNLRIEHNGDHESGDLYCQHPYGFEGYMDEAGNWLVQAQDWHRTGDAAKKNDNGEIIVTGRADNSINRSGFLILLADIEKALETFDSVTQAVVVPINSTNIQGQTLVAFCVKAVNTSPTETELRSASSKILPKYGVPDVFLMVDNLPLLPSGKPDQQALKKQAEAALSLSS